MKEWLQASPKAKLHDVPQPPELTEFLIERQLWQELGRHPEDIGFWPPEKLHDYLDIWAMEAEVQNEKMKASQHSSPSADRETDKAYADLPRKKRGE